MRSLSTPTLQEQVVWLRSRHAISVWRAAASAVLAATALGTAAIGAEGGPPHVELLPPLDQVPQAARTVVSLEEFRSLAVARHPAIAEARARVAALRGEWLQVGLRANPIIGYAAEEVGNLGSAGLQGGFVQQRIITGCKRQLSRRVAAFQIARAEQELATRTMQVVNDIRMAYYEALIAERRTEILQRLENVADESLNIARRLLAAQEGDRVSVLQATTEWNTARARRMAARVQADAARRRLATIAGIPEMADFDVSGDPTVGIPQIEWQQATDRLLAESPQLAAAAAEIDRARAAIARACAGRIPDVTAMASVQYDDESGDTVAGVGLQIPLQLYDRNQGNVFRAQSELIAAHATARRAELDLQSRLAAAFGRYAAAARQVAQYQTEILPVANEAWELMRTGYEQDQVNFVAVLTAQRTYIESSLAYMDRVQEAWQAAIEIEGLLLSGSLRNLNSYR